MLPQLQAQYNLSDPSAPTYTAGKRAVSVAIEIVVVADGADPVQLVEPCLRS
jgi:hypothetical protein